MTLYFKPATRVLSGALMVMALSGPAQAANFEFARYLEIGTTATDNPELELDPQDSELVWNIKPSVELKFSGNRIGAIVVGQVEYFKFTRADGDIVDPRLFARTRGTLVDGLMYLDSTLIFAKLSPDSNFLRLSQDGDPAVALKGRLFIDKSFGQVADLYTAYNHGSFFDSVETPVSSVRNGVEIYLGRNPKYGGVFWGLGANYDHDESTDDLFENSGAYASLGATFSKTLFGKVTAGMEDRKLTDDINTATPTISEDEESSLWEASFTWKPSERTTLTAGYGERFFGAGPSFQFKHRTENSNVLARFSRDISRSAATLDAISALTGTTGTSLPSDTGSVSIDNATLAAELDEPFVDNRFQLGYKLTGRRSDFIVDAVYSVQDPLTGADDSIETWLGRLIFDRKLSELTSLRLQYDYRKSDAPNRANLTYDENRIGIKFIFNFDKVEPTNNDEFTE